MCIVLLSPGGNPIAVNKYIISYQKKLKKNSKYTQLRNIYLGSNNEFYYKTELIHQPS